MGWRFALILLVVVSASAAPATVAAAETSSPTFLSTLTVTAPGGVASAVSFGVRTGATQGFDVGIDQPAPPPPPGSPWVQAITAAGAGDTTHLRTSIMAPAEELVWDFRIDKDGAAGALALRFDDAMVDALPARLALDVTVEGTTHDLRDLRVFEMEVPEGLATRFVRVRVSPLAGAPPSPPQELMGSAGPAPGEATLSWTEPADSGGHPSKGYEVFRARDEGPMTIVGTTRKSSFLDHGLEVGAQYRYQVVALNRVGRSEPSNPVEVIGTGKPAMLQPKHTDDAHEDVGRINLSRDERKQEVPGTTFALLHLRGAEQSEDPRYYDVEATRPDGGSHHATLYTAGLFSEPLDVRLFQSPALQATAPAARVHASATTACAGEYGGEVAIRSSASAAPIAFADETAVPLSPSACEWMKRPVRDS